MRSDAEILAEVSEVIERGSVAKARELLLCSLQERPSSTLLLQALGDIALHGNNLAEARHYFSKVASIDPTDTYALVNLAMISLKLGDTAEYKAAFNSAIQNDPQAKEIFASLLPNSSLATSASPALRQARAVGSPFHATPDTSVPVVILQLGHRFYLNYVIEEARRRNAEVILLADYIDDSLKEKVEFASIAPFREESTHFFGVYQHLSSNPWTAELFCFARWFLLKAYMQSRNLEVCFHIDSDVLLYVDAQRELLENFNAGYEWTLISGTVGCTSFVTFEGLTRFCDFLRDTYENKSGARYRYLLDLHQKTIEANQPGGVSDMALLDLYRRESGAKIGEMTDVIKNATFDQNIGVSEGYEMYDGFKKIYPHKGLPYCKRLSDGAFIRFKSLHFSGAGKGILRPMAEQIRKSAALA
jgi:tetratricopeptide (TPR) repeat protein